MSGGRGPESGEDLPLKHVIEEYRHRAQRVTCVCGWEGSTESVLGAPSAWALHVRESKLGEAKTGTTD